MFEDYDIVSVAPPEEGGYIVATERVASLREGSGKPDMRQIGTSGKTTYNWEDDEYNPRLRGYEGLKTYDEMRKSDGQIRSTLRLIKTPVIAGRWYMHPASRSTQDVNAAEFAWKCLTEEMSIPFNQLLMDALTMMDFGYSLFEKVWVQKKVDGANRIIWQKLMPLRVQDVQSWEFDAQGGPKRANVYTTQQKSFSGVAKPINIDKLLVFSFDREAGNITGTSVLRSAYKHWYFKSNLEKIDAIQKERHGIGVPIIKLPPNFTSVGANNDVDLANEIGRNLRVNESAHVVLPPMWELEFAKLEGQPVDSIVSIEYHNRMILANVLAPWFDGGTTDVAVLNDLFLKAARFVADTIADSLNQYAIKQLIDYNFSRVGYPKLKVRRIGETTDWRTFSFALRNLVGADMLRADEPLEEYLRHEMDLPLYDEASDRKEEEIARQEEQAELAHERSMEAVAAKPAPGQAGGGANPKSSGNGKTKNKGAQAGLPRQTPPKPRSGTGGKRVGKPSNNSQGK